MLLQATLNGPLTKADHPELPISLEELAADAVSCVAAGARAFHVHPRSLDGTESLSAEIVDQVVAAVKSRQPHPVGVTTGAWIEPDVQRRRALVAEWTQPDYTSVNLSEPGALEMVTTLLSTSVGIEAGVWTVEDAVMLVQSGLGDRILRIMIEPVDVSTNDAIPLMDDIHLILDNAELQVPRLQHGDGEATWVLLEDAVRRGIDTRIGFEDTLYLPDGRLASSNADLVRAACELGAG